MSTIGSGQITPPPILPPNQNPCILSHQQYWWEHQRGGGIARLSNAPNGAYQCSESTVIDPLKSHLRQPCFDCFFCRHHGNWAIGQCQWVRRANLLHQNSQRQPINGCGHCCPKPYRCCEQVVRIIVKLIVIFFYSFNVTHLLRSMLADCCMPWYREWGTMAAVGRRMLP